MEVINLNEFKRGVPVTIDGTQYTIRRMVIEEYIERGHLKRIDAANTQLEQAEIMIEVLLDFCDVPKEVLYKQTFEVLMAMILIIQGVDPAKALKDQQAAKKN